MTFCIDPFLVRKHFPYAKLIFCVRNPCEAFPSFVAMIAALRSIPIGGLENRLKTYFDVVSKAMYNGMALYPGDTNTYFHNFNDWKQDSPKSL